MVKLQRVVGLVIVVILIAGCGLGGEPVAPTAAPTAPSPTPTHEPSAAPPPTPLPTPSPDAAAPATPPPAAASSAVAEAVARLQGLPIDEFFDESYRQLLLRKPQSITLLGLGDAWGVGNDRLNNLSDAYLRDTQALEVAVLDLLRAYDRAGLAPGQQLTYDVYEWYLDDLVRGHPFMYHNFPVNHFLGSYDQELVQLFTELHPLEDEQDARDYVTRLSQVDVQVEQLLEGLKIREELGIIPPRAIIDMTVLNLNQWTGSDVLATPFYWTLAEKLVAMRGLSDHAKQELLAEAEAEVNGSVLPALRALAGYVEGLRAVAPTAFGAWQYPDGDAYYAYLLHHEASTDLTPDEVHELGLAEVERIRAEMRQVFDELGYPPDGSQMDLMNRAIQEAGAYDIQTEQGKQRLIEAFEQILDRADRRLDEVVDLRPTIGVEVVGDYGFTGGGYYVPGSLDGSRSGAFHTGIGGSQVPKFSMATTAYHEAIPGHHFQIAIAQELDLPLLRNDVFFNAYAEGWALYAERLAYELGLYQDDPYGNLGRLQMELLRAVRLVVDTGIHAKKWSQAEAKAYMNEVLGDVWGQWSGEVERYVAWPAQAIGYKIGMLKILDLRQRAMDALGDGFDLKEFHRLILGSGSMPLELLERLVQAHIDARLAGWPMQDCPLGRYSNDPPMAYYRGSHG